MALAVSDLWADRLVDGYSENHSVSGSSVTEAYTCDWGDRLTYKDLLLGAAHSDTTGYSDWACNTVGIETKGWTDDQIHPIEAVLTATYSSMLGSGSIDPQTSDMTLWHENWQAGGEAVTVGRGFKWAEAPANPLEKAGVSAVKIVPQATITLSARTGVDTAAKTKIAGCLGKVNDDAVTLKGHSYATETLLFLGADLDEAEGADGGGKRYHSIGYKFAAFFDHTWNEFFRDDTEWTKDNEPAWQEIVSIKDAAKKPYLTADFDDLDPAGW